jgi:nucleotide-binding universal stress UspA family protein
LKLERIVLATAHEVPDPALDAAIAIAARAGARLDIFHAVDSQPVEPVDLDEKERRTHAFFELAEARLRQELEAAGTGTSSVPIIEHTRVGRPSDEVVSFAEENGADLIVVGTHGRRGLLGLIRGSVTESVVRRAPCPVLAVRVPEASEPACPPPGFERVVAAVDESDPSRAALVAASDLAARWGGRVTAVHVLDDTVLAQASTLSPIDVSGLEVSLARAAEDRLRQFVLETLGSEEAARVRCVVEMGLPAESVVRVAVTEDAGAIACGTHGRTGLRRALFGSVAERILRLAAVPVLTVREGRASARIAA